MELQRDRGLQREKVTGGEGVAAREEAAAGEGFAVGEVVVAREGVTVGERESQQNCGL